MSPSYVTEQDDEGHVRRERGSERTLPLVGLRVSTIRIRHGEVALFDEEGRESLLIQRGSYPGAGLSVDLADHVEIR